MPLSLSHSPHSTLRILLRLSRANMTTITAVTYLTASSLPQLPFNLSLFFRGYLFILSTQFATHFLGELHDLASDKLNIHATPLTGGSRVLTAHPKYLSLTRRAAFVTMCFSAALIAFALPDNARLVAAVMLALALAYTTPPFKLNHRALGELDAAYITSALVPYFGATVQGALSGRFPFYDASLALLIIPPTLVKFGLFLMLNLADRRADWAGGKITLAVLLGDRASIRLYTVCMAVAYVAVVAISVCAEGWERWGALFVMPTLWFGWRIVRALLRHVPYRLDPFLGPVLLHSTFMVWSVLVHALVGGKVGVPQIVIATVFLCITMWNVRKGKGRMKKRDAEEESKAGERDVVVKVGNSARIPRAGRENSTREVEGAETGDGDEDLLSAAEEGVAAGNEQCTDVSRDIVIVGGGVGGLVAAAALSKMGMSVIVLERRTSAEQAEAGADLALWPGAISVLKGLGVAEEFFQRDCFPLETVCMCNMDFSRIGEGGSATVLKVIDMAEVTEGTGEKFVLVTRQRLMDAIRGAVPEGLVVYAIDVLDVVEDEENNCAYTKFSAGTNANLPVEFVESHAAYCIKSRVVIAADGARSRLKAHVSPTHGGADAVRFCGEVCYRGVLDSADSGETGHLDGVALQRDAREKVTSLFPDQPTDCTMRINYGAGLRSSFGYMSADGEVAYWWVKVQMEQMPQSRGKLKVCNWPEPLKTLHDITTPSAFYMHPVEDSAPLPKWSTPRVVLVGDAAHVVTPNMGQGACLATEDAFVLAIELVKYWKWPDGHLEAFYNYERSRRPYAETVAAEARRQLFLGQLQSRLAVYLREMLLRLVPAGILQNKLKRNNFPVKPYLDEFREAAKQAMK